MRPTTWKQLSCAIDDNQSRADISALLNGIEDTTKANLSCRQELLSQLLTPYNPYSTDDKYAITVLLLDHGVLNDIDVKIFFGETIMYLIHCPRMIELFLNRGANVNLQNNYGETALMLAASKDKKLTVELLLNHGADQGINLQDKTGQTALMYAASSGNINIVELLLNHGAKQGINLQDLKQETALIKSARRDPSGNMVQMLCLCGADKTIRNHANWTAWMITAWWGYTINVNTLLENCDAFCDSDVDRLMVAVEQTRSWYLNKDPTALLLIKHRQLTMHLNRLAWYKLGADIADIIADYATTPRRNSIR